MGVVGMLWLLVWFPFYDDPEKSKRLTPGELAHIRSDGVPDEAGERPLGWARSSATARRGRSSSPSC